MRNDEVDNEAQKKNSWAQTEELLKEMFRLGTIYSDNFKPLFGIIDVLRSRGFDSLFYAVQSHGRLGISRTLQEPDLSSSVVITSHGEEKIECELFLRRNSGFEVTKREFCDSSSAPDLIERFVKLLD